MAKLIDAFRNFSKAPNKFNTGSCKYLHFYSGADKSLARPGRKQATATEDFEFHISYL